MQNLVELLERMTPRQLLEMIASTSSVFDDVLETLGAPPQPNFPPPPWDVYEDPEPPPLPSPEWPKPQRMRTLMRMR